MNSRILVVLPTLGERQELLKETLESIISQSEKPDIVIVCPKDNKQTLKLAKQVGAIVVDDPGSLSEAVNSGIEAANENHEFISWIGDDDLLTPDSLKTTAASLDSNPNAVLAYGYCEYIDNKGKKLFTSRAGNFAPWLMTWGPNLVPLPGILFRKSALLKTSGFDPSLKYSMDLDMLLKLRKHGQFVNTHKTLAAFRWHSDSTTVANRNASLKEAEYVKRRYLSPILRPIAFLWELPVKWATKLAAKRVNRMIVS